MIYTRGRIDNNACTAFLISFNSHFLSPRVLTILDQLISIVNRFSTPQSNSKNVAKMPESTSFRSSSLSHWHQPKAIQKYSQSPFTIGEKRSSVAGTQCWPPGRWGYSCDGLHGRWIAWLRKTTNWRSCADFDIEVVSAVLKYPSCRDCYLSLRTTCIWSRQGL